MNMIYAVTQTNAPLACSPMGLMISP